ncbi:hypothetical protein [Cupriavidus taiwanensis]|uniref:Uncharacterized protein n=1 Tax=Cupriavidus taiwanensis TaxID=164546 RepID=A0A976A1A5_9BURK|nr:hypothetical protein CBM2587_A230152 [Cupriavidus taiwanensis]
MAFEATDNSMRVLDGTPAVELEAFPSEFVSKLSGIARCLNEGNDKPFGIRSGEPYEINFQEPAYVASIEIEFSKSAVGAGIELSVFDALAGRQVRKRCMADSLANKVAFEVRCVSSGVSIYLPPSYFELFRRRTLLISRIRILGFFPDDFASLSESLSQLQGLREAAIAELGREKASVLTQQEKVLQRETAVAQLEVAKNAELAALQEEIEETQAGVTEAAAKLAALKDDVARADARKQALVDQIGAKEATIRDIEGETSKRKEHLRSLAEDTSSAERRLRELTSNVNLFSEEFSSFSDHGAKQAWTFLWLSAVPLGIIAILTVQLLWGAVDLSVKYVKEPNLDLMTVFVTRLPYLAVCFSILTVCYSALRFLFNRISAIYAERLDFAKIGIVAKDVAFASASGLALSDKELYEARTYLKIEMLKSYLSGNIGVYAYTKRTINLEEPRNLDSEKLPTSTVPEAVEDA